MQLVIREPVEWIGNELSTANFGDERLNRRAQSILDAMMAQPAASIPVACRGWNETQAAYRFFDNIKVAVEPVLLPHQQATLERIEQHKRILCIQNTIELDFSHQKHTSELGPLNDEARQGLYLHPTLAITPEGVPLGILDRHVCAMADREGDIYELLREAKTQDYCADYLIRCAQDCVILGEIEFTLPSTHDCKQKQITQQLKAVRVTLRPLHRSHETLAPFGVTVILAQETKPPKGEKPITWVLMSNIVVNTPIQALEMLNWYICRWQIEIYFRVLKSGGKIEKLQLESDERLRPALAMYMIVAWRVLYLIMLSRTCPDIACDVVFDTDEWHAIYLVTNHQEPPSEPPPLNEMVRMIASFGGFINRKHDGESGPQAIWIGLQRARDFVLAINASKAISST